MGKTFTFLVFVAAVAALGVTALEIRNIRDSLDKTTAGSEANITEMMISLAHTDNQLARIRERVELLGGSSGADEAAALEGKITASLTAAQRQVLQQELEKWAGQLTAQREEGLAALRQELVQGLSRSAASTEAWEERWQELKVLVQQNQQNLTARLTELSDAAPSASAEAVEQQGTVLTGIEEQLAAVLAVVEKGQEDLAQRTEQNEERWQELSQALEEGREAAQQRFDELAARLEESRREAAEAEKEAAAPAQEESPAQESPGGEARNIERERLVEFCAEVPNADICKDL